VTAKPLSTAALVVYAFAVALGLGVGSAYWALAGEYPFGGVAGGPWIAWPAVGSREVDPYARSIVTRRADIPLATGEGLVLTAAADSAGRRLDSACTYTVGAVTPQARLWTLTLYDQDGGFVPSELKRSGFTSAEVLRDDEGRFGIVLSRQLQAGNWLKLPDSGAFTLVLRLYETPAALGTGAIDAKTLPTIERGECA